MDNYKNWEQRVYGAIRDISDIEFQKRAWLSNGNEVSSFSEIICTLYDDSFFDEFLEENDLTSKNIDYDIILEMKLLKHMLDLYDSSNDESIILRDPQWHAIVEQAKKIIELHDKKNH